MSKPSRRRGTRVSVQRLVPAFAFGCTVLAGCSSDFSRFENPFSFTSGNNGQTTSTISPRRPVYNSAREDARAGDPYYGRSSAGYSDHRPTAATVAPQRSQQISERAPVPPVRRYQLPSYSQPQSAGQSRQYGGGSAQTYTPPARKLAAVGGQVSVRPGDTLYSIARNNNVSVSALKQANSLSGDSISIGQTLVLPGQNVITNTAPRRNAAVAPGNGGHKVQSGDTVFSIARQYGVHHSELVRHNNLSDPNQISLGQVLAIPGQPGQSGVGTKVVAATEVAAPKRAAAPVPTVRRPALPKTPKKVEAAPRQVAKLDAPEARSQGKFRWPVRGRVISKFGAKADGSHNDGINVAVPAGTAVKAAENGVVAYAGNELKGYGNLVLIRHADNWVTAYAHNEELLVRRGDKVKRGQVISRAGRTGSVAQPQVHFELRRGSKPVNPLNHMAGL